MDKSIQYPKTPFDIETCTKILEIGRKLGLSDSTITTIKEELHFDEAPSYPDGE
jgi:hypothetical protein